ncbi:hypothetical protein PUN28_004648 [Cardiocondyla obscurior]|uniref:Uncharacterized protein n=1 Tax=Cardiocondyla obscurior TaxID=286306 RepID=A0AAW2GCI0_9HYME
MNSFRRSQSMGSMICAAWLLSSVIVPPEAAMSRHRGLFRQSANSRTSVQKERAGDLRKCHLVDGDQPMLLRYLPRVPKLLEMDDETSMQIPVSTDSAALGTRILFLRLYEGTVPRPAYVLSHIMYKKYRKTAEYPAPVEKDKERKGFHNKFYAIVHEIPQFHCVGSEKAPLCHLPRFIH